MQHVVWADVAIEGLKILVSLVIGAFLGLEREYRSKAAGFSTITLICIGSTLFTIASQHLGGNGQSDRIASNIITGIGFIGAGIIFKNELSVSGLTTAATIWIAAALGMLVGNDEFLLAFAAFAAVMFVLSVFDRLKYFVDVIHQERTYKIIFNLNRTNSGEVEELCKSAGLRVKKIKEYRSEAIVSVYLQVSGSLEKQMHLNQQLLESNTIQSFEY